MCSDSLNVIDNKSSSTVTVGTTILLIHPIGTGASILSIFLSI